MIHETIKDVSACDMILKLPGDAPFPCLSTTRYNNKIEVIEGPLLARVANHDDILNCRQRILGM